MIRIRYTGLTTADLNPEWTALGELFVHVEADISIWDGERKLYSEILFPVLELASRVHDWTRVDPVERKDFELDSLFRGNRHRADSALRFGLVPGVRSRAGKVE